MSTNETKINKKTNKPVKKGVANLFEIIKLGSAV